MDSADNPRQRRQKGSGGVHRVDEGLWRVDIELPREPGAPRRRVARQVRGDRAEAEAVLAELVAQHPTPLDVTVSTRVSAETADALRRRAAAGGRSVADEIRLAISAWVGTDPQ